MNKTLSLQEIQQLHRDGHLEEAKSAYLQLLEISPENAEVLHYLGVLYAEEGDLGQAEQCLEKAIYLDPEDLSIRLHLANVYKAGNRCEKAIAVLREIIRLNPVFAAAYNNLGTVYDAGGQWTEAISAYQTAIDLQPNYADAYYNLGLALNKAKRPNEAFNTYQALLELLPAHSGARFQLGRLYMQRDQYQDAIDQLSKVEESYPYHFETQSNLATCFLKLGWMIQAKTHYQKALNIKPDDIQALFNLGVIAMQQGSIQEAIESYRRALIVDPDHFDVHNNLGVIFLLIKNKENAIKHFREAARLQPNNKALLHTLRILARDEVLLSSPPEYVRALFNSYADHYDAHLKGILHYDVPKYLLQAVKKTNHPYRDILDLGCGTGLCGEYFQDEKYVLTGVDISDKMLEVAKQKNIYQDLIEADIADFLKNQHEDYDLILAGDVLIYFGELGELFSLVHNALRPSGLFAFTAEIHEDKDYEMTESGRFAHGKTYLDRVIQTTGFRTLDYGVIPLREQEGVGVSGHLYLLVR